jgi:Holliday junction resolvasome RuvABC endonuclease subunit
MTITNPKVNSIGLLALDQSTVQIGHSTWLNGKLESWGNFKPDWPKLDFLRSFIKDYCGQFRAEGLSPTIVIEDIYMLNTVTFKQLAILRGHIEAATYECGAELHVITANSALFCLTGMKSSPRNPIKRPERKRLIIEAASRLAGESLQEDAADSVAIAVAYLHSITQQAIPLSE